MYDWKLTQSLDNPKDPEWDLLATKILGRHVHPDRKQGFLLARSALLQLLSERGIAWNISQLQLKNFSEVQDLPDLILSLSHSKTHGAALLADKSQFQSVGIDIENVEREVKASIAERIAHSADAKLRNIELWCLKEAVFKALMNTRKFPNPLEFSSIEIQDKFWSHSPSSLKGEWEIHQVGTTLVALAFLKN